MGKKIVTKKVAKKKVVTTARQQGKTTAAKQAVDVALTPPPEPLAGRVNNFDLPEIAAAELADFYYEAGNLTTLINAREREMFEAKQEAKFATEAFAEAQAELKRHVEGYRAMPLFDGEQEVGTDTDEEWRAVPIADLDIEEWIINAFADEDVSTAGEMDYAMTCADHPVVQRMDASQEVIVGGILDKLATGYLPDPPAKKKPVKKTTAKKPVKKVA